MKKTAFFITIITILVKILGFIREMTLSYYYGTSNVSDAYLISLTIPGTIFSFIATGLATSYIPSYTAVLKEKGESFANFFTNNVVNIILIICTVLIIIVWCFTEQVVFAFASGFDKETFELAVVFTKIGITGIYFSGLMYVFNAFLQVKNKFLVTVLNGIPLNIVGILFIVISSRNSSVFLSLGNTLAVAIPLIFLIPSAYKVGYKYSVNIDFKSIYIKHMLLLSLPVMFGVCVNQINVLIDRSIASTIVTGGISSLTYADHFNTFINGIIITSISTVMYPMIAKMAANNNIENLKKNVLEVINIIILFVLPASIGLIFLANPIISFVFGRGEFSSKSIDLTSRVLAYYSIGMVGSGIREVLSRVFYALQDTKTPTKNAIVALILNMLLNIILSKIFGLSGLALATSISALFASIMLILKLRKKIGPLGLRACRTDILKILVISIITGGFSKVIYKCTYIQIGVNSSVLLAISLSIIVYLVGVYTFKVKQVRKFAQEIINKLFNHN